MTEPRRLPVVDEGNRAYEHPLYGRLLSAPGLSVATTAIDRLLEWGATNSLWVFPMATSCCGIELMSAAASRVDLDRMGTIVRATPRQSDVMVIAGTITVKMAPRVKALWDQMPEPKWAIAMGSCAISGDFYRNLYSVIPGIDTVLPVDVYVPGCPPNPEALMHGLLRLQEKVRLRRAGKLPPREEKPNALELTRPSIPRFGDAARDGALDAAQVSSAMTVTSLERSAEPEAGSVQDEPAPRTTEPAGDLEALFRGHGVTEIPKDAAPVVPVERHVPLARRLRDGGYEQLVYIAATHFAAKTGAKPQPERFEVAYALRTVGKGSRIASWRVALAPGEGIPTLVGVFAGADWQEREQYDLVGIRFDGHPDLRRIMLPDSWTGHPLRKDYPADTACPPWR
ncbi:MAG: NADH-quinone oxidoreductase subunit NuoB [Polyangiaceae bacterium]